MKRKHILFVTIMLSVAMALGGCALQPHTTVEEEVEENIEEESTEVEEVEEDTEVVEAPDASLMTTDSLDVVAAEVSADNGEGNEESTHPIEEEDVEKQIVFLGDSIFDSVRDNTGIAFLVGDTLNADVYNLAIGGTTCAVHQDDFTQLDKWNNPSLMGLIYAMEGKVSPNILKGYKSGEVFAGCDFSKTDYFIIEYGTNDFLSYIPLGAEHYHGQYYFYFRTTWDTAINELQTNFPDAKIILCTPYYEEFWSADKTRYIGDIHTVNNGFGTLLDYISVIEDAGRDHGIPVINMYDLLGVDIATVNDMTVDGIHPSEGTRAKYAELLVQAIEEIEETGTTTLDTQERIKAAQETSENDDNNVEDEAETSSDSNEEN